MDNNQLVLSGTATEIAPLAYTPAGIPILTLTLVHESRQEEAGMQRQVACAVPVVALATLAQQAAKLPPDSAIRVTGFLARKSLNSRQLVLHANSLKIIEKGE